MKTNRNCQQTSDNLKLFILTVFFLAIHVNVKSNSILPLVNCVPNAPICAGNDATICAGESLLLNATVACSTGNNVYEWTTSGTGTFSSTDALISQYIPSMADISAGTVNLTITRTSASSCDNGISDFLVLSINPVPSAPVASYFSMAALCSGQTISLNATAVPNASAYEWIGPGFSSNQQNTSIILTSGTMGPFSVTATANGCISPPSNAVYIDVIALPDVTISPTSLQICSGETASINISSTAPSPTFNWTVNSNTVGAINGNGANINQTLTNANSIPATVTYTIIPTSEGCEGPSTAIIVTVNPLPTINNTPSALTICSEETINISLNSTVQSSFVWTVETTGVDGAAGGNGSNINQTLSNSNDVSGAATYVITPTALNTGCVGNQYTITVTVNPLPTVTPNPINQTICSGQQTAISLSSNVLNTSFNWTVIQIGVTGASTSGGSAITQTLTNSGDVPGTATYEITGTASNCSGSSTNVTVTVNPNLTATVNYAGNPFCQSLISGQDPTIIGASNGTFSTATGLNINANSGIINPNLSTAGIYNITYTIPGLPGCPDFVTPNIEIVIATPPDAILAPETPAFICENGSAFFEVNSGLFNSYTNYSWSVLDADNIPIGTVVNNGQTMQYSIGNLNEETTIFVNLNETIGTCSNSSITPIVVRVNPETCGFFELAGDVLAACSEVGSNYQWGCGTTAIAGENSNSFVHTAFSQFNNCIAFWVQVSLYDDFSCPVYLGDASQVTGIFESVVSDNFSIYPNPASTSLTIMSQNELNGIGLIQIFSLDGRICFAEKAASGSTRYLLDINHLSSGSYLLSITHEKGRVVKPFVVSK